MEIGYRILRPSDVGKLPLSFVQISLWRTANWGVAEGEQAVREAIEIASACKERGVRWVFHPLEYPLTGEHAPHTQGVLRRLAAASDLGIIIHDEGGESVRGLSAAEEETFERNLAELGGFCPVSIENAFNSADISRFWERFVVPAPPSVSITIDIGHLEAADMDSVSFLRNLPERLAGRVNFVHMHHKTEEGLGIKDHRPLVPGCRELEALKVLLFRRPDVRVVLELDAAQEGMGESIELLRRV